MAQFLIATPQNKNPDFAQTVLLLTEFNSSGAMAFVLNRPLEISSKHIISSEKPDLPEDETIPAFWGGPVQNELGFLIHEDAKKKKDSIVLDAGIFLTGSMEYLSEMLTQAKSNEPPRFRFLLGYSGWSAGQLETEISESFWITAPFNKDLLFKTKSEDLWKKSIESLGFELGQLMSESGSQVH